MMDYLLKFIMVFIMDIFYYIFFKFIIICLYTFHYLFKLWNVSSYTSHTFKQLKTVLIILAHFSKEHSYQETKMTRFIYTAAEYTHTQIAGKFFQPMAKVAAQFWLSNRGNKPAK